MKEHPFPFLHLSEIARAGISKLLPHDLRQKMPDQNDVPGWQEMRALVDARLRPISERAISEFTGEVEYVNVSGMPAIHIVPEGVDAQSIPMVYIHGGAFVFQSAYGKLCAAIPLAEAFNRPLYSLDYALAPEATFHQIIPACVRALQAVCAQSDKVLVVGNSAGGAIALSATRKVIEGGGKAPTEVILLSPCVALDNSGDSHETLKDYDPILSYDLNLNFCFDVYAPEERNHPDASPLYANYTAKFPRTLIQCGTREILMSDSIRLHHKLSNSGVNCELDIYKGLFHSFQSVIPKSPEAVLARQNMVKWSLKH